MWELGEYRCPPGFNKRSFDAMVPWKVWLLSSGICAALGIAVMVLVIKWGKAHRNDEDSGDEQSASSAARFGVY